MELEFCGRESELQTLKTAWSRVSDEREAQSVMAVVKAERGVGKTRLVLEFYRWLCTQQPATDELRYWPPTLPMNGSFLDVNPQTAACQFGLPVPFLWWGLRAGDTERENSITRDALATYSPKLVPHLLALKNTADMRERGKELLALWKDLGIDLATNALQIDTAISVARTLFETARFVHGAVAGDVTESVRREEAQRTQNRTAAILDDLETVLTRRRRCPAVIFIDDAQFIHKDAALPGFVERLIHRAFAQRWPLLIIATHWQREFQNERELLAAPTGFASILRSARTSADDKGPAAGMPVGYLPDDAYYEIELRPDLELGRELSRHLPGLDDTQVRAIAERARGNPRHLEQMIRYLTENEGLFQEHDLKRPLTSDGLEEVLTESHDIYKVVFARLRQAPKDVQEAICLASIQGVEFVNDLVDQLGYQVLSRSVHDALEKAEQPYSMIAGVAENASAVGEFVEGLFFEASRKQRKNLKDLGGENGLQEALDHVLRESLKEDRRRPDDEKKTNDAHALTLLLCAQRFEQADPPLAGYALARLVRVRIARNDFEAALTAADTLAQNIDTQVVVDSLPGTLCLTVVRLLTDNGRIRQAQDLFDPLLAIETERARLASSDQADWELTWYWLQAGAIAAARGDDKGAMKFYIPAAQTRARLGHANNDIVTLGRTADALSEVSAVALRVGDYELVDQTLEICVATRESQLRRSNDGAIVNALAVALIQVGDLALLRQENDKAAQAYERSRVLLRELIEQDGTLTNRMNLMIATHGVGAAAAARGDHARVQAMYLNALETARDVVQRSSTPHTRRSLTVALVRFGDALRAAGNLEKAAQAYGESREISVDLLLRLGTRQAQRDLSVALEKTGLVARIAENYDTAASDFEQSLNLRRNLVASGESREACRDYCVSLFRCAENALAAGDAAKAHAFLTTFDEALPNSHPDDRADLQDNAEQLRVAIN